MFFIDEITVNDFFESLLSLTFTRLPVQELDFIHDRMKERKIGTVLNTPKKLSLFIYLWFFLDNVQFSSQLGYSLSDLKLLGAFKLRFFNQTSVVGLNQLIDCTSVFKSEDRVFKLMFFLQLNYTEECKHL